MRYSPDVVEEVRVQTDLVDLVSAYLPLKQRGNSYVGLCPFHHEKTPSFSVSPDKQLYYCFGCGASGNAYSFVMQMENCDFPEALKRLADRAHISLPEEAAAPGALAAQALKERLYALHGEAGRFFYEQLHQPVGREALAYLERRRVSPQMARKFGLGFAPGHGSLRQRLEAAGFSPTEMEQSGLVLPGKDGSPPRDRFYDRLMFPIFDGVGRCIGFGGRILGKGEPKYLNSPETVLFNKSHTLYGLHFAKKTRKRELLLVEGYMDLLTVYQAGFHNIVAGLGTALNQEHVKVLRKAADAVILLYDSDEAGQKAARRAIPLLLAGGLAVRVAKIPDGKDPDEFLQTHPPADFARVLADAQSHVDFAIGCIRAQYNLDNPEHKIRFATETAALLAGLPNPIEAEVYARQTGAETGIEAATLLSEVERLRVKEETAFTKKAEKERLRLYDKTPEGGERIPKGLLEAQKDLLRVCAGDRELWAEVLTYLSPEEFPTPTFAALARLMADCLEKGESMLPAELVSHFPDLEEARLVSETFARAAEYPDPATLKKALREEIFQIKRAKLEAELENADILQLKSLLDKKRELDTLVIFPSENHGQEG